MLSGPLVMLPGFSICPHSTRHPLPCQLSLSLIYKWEFCINFELTSILFCHWIICFFCKIPNSLDFKTRGLQWLSWLSCRVTYSYVTTLLSLLKKTNLSELHYPYVRSSKLLMYVYTSELYFQLLGLPITQLLPLLFNYKLLRLLLDRWYS